MTNRWRILPHNRECAAHLEKSAGIAPVVAHLLAARGVTDSKEAKRFLEAKMKFLRDPEEIPGLADAAERVHRAAQNGRRIVVYGDYDADGMTGTAILHRCLRLLGADVRYHVPDRLEEGYGLNCEALKELAKSGTHMVVSVDCGITSMAPAATARQLGLSLIVTDHHEMAAELPDADAIVHPRLPGHSPTFGGICGAGVALKLAWAICQHASDAKKVRPAMQSFLLAAMGLAAIGTVADVVPLIDDNRILVRHGANGLLHSPLEGIKAMLRQAELDKKSNMASEDIAFQLAPRLNAAGRLGQARLGVELLVTDSPSRAKELADYLQQLNKQRSTLENRIYLAAKKQIADNGGADSAPALVLCGEDWHPGVVGIVAGRLAEKYHRPVVLLSVDPLRVKPATGSARGVPGVHLVNALHACNGILEKYGGHAAAAGMSLPEAHIDTFREHFCEAVAEQTGGEAIAMDLAIDAEATFSQLSMRTVSQLEQLAPFGEGNPRPALCATNVRLTNPPKKIGGGERHLSATLRQHDKSMRAVAFGHADWAEPLSRHDGPIDIVFQPLINEFRNRRSVEVQLIDWRKSNRVAHPPAEDQEPPF